MHFSTVLNVHLIAFSPSALSSICTKIAISPDCVTHGMRRTLLLSAYGHVAWLLHFRRYRIPRSITLHAVANGADVSMITAANTGVVEITELLFHRTY